MKGLLALVWLCIGTLFLALLAGLASGVWYGAYRVGRGLWP